MAHKKFCSSCGQNTLHNESGKKDAPPRCTYCGSPVTTNPAKREHFESLRRKQVAKLGRF